MGIRILVDLNKPFRRGTILKSKEGSIFKILFKFERLLDFYYSYGRAGHLLKDCGEKEQDEDGDNSNMFFVPWLRASSTRTRIFSGREEGRNKNHQKMIFKHVQRGETHEHILEGNSTEKERDLEDEGREVGRNWDCMVVTDSGTILNEAPLSEEQAKGLVVMVKSLSSWHINPKGQELSEYSKRSGKGDAVRILLC